MKAVIIISLTALNRQLDIFQGHSHNLGRETPERDMQGERGVKRENEGKRGSKITDDGNPFSRLLTHIHCEMKGYVVRCSCHSGDFSVCVFSLCIHARICLSMEKGGVCMISLHCVVVAHACGGSIQL